MDDGEGEISLCFWRIEDGFQTEDGWQKIKGIDSEGKFDLEGKVNVMDCLKLNVCRLVMLIYNYISSCFGDGH